MTSLSSFPSQRDQAANKVLGNISVVIPTLGRPILEQSLTCLARGSSWPAEVIVVDQGSNSEVALWIEEMNCAGIGARHVLSKQRGRAAGLNRGIEKALTEFVAITDDDCFVAPDWLANMAEILGKNPSSIVTGRVDPGGEHTLITVTSMVPVVYRQPRLKFDSMSGGNMGTSLSVIRRVGFFDEDPRLRTAEDAEWSYRALRKGVPILYAPEVSVQHYGWRDPQGRNEQYRGYARSHGGFYGKYIRKGDLFILTRALVHHLRAMRRWGTGLVSGNAELAASGKAYFTGLLPGIIMGLRAEGTDGRS